MNERELRDALRRTPIDATARERSSRVVHAAYRAQAHSQHVRARSRGRWIGAVVAACLTLALVTVSVTRAPADALAQWLRDAVGVRERDARPVLGALPGGGRLLVSTGTDAWIVAPDGGKRRLGSYEGASWSPRGLFAVAWRDGELTALEPDGDVRWSLRRPEAVHAARWAPGDGYRIAYLAGRALRVVNGDGSGDRHFADARAGVAPAWRPGTPRHELAYVDSEGGVRLADVDGGRELWRAGRFGDVQALAWSADGRRLLVARARQVTLLASDGRLLDEQAVGGGTEAAWSPRGHAAFVRRHARSDRSDVVLLDPAHGIERILFRVPGRTLGPIAWSPDGRLLLVSWREADQWLLLSPERRRPVRAVADIARQFAPGSDRGRFPERVEWAPGP